MTYELGLGITKDFINTIDLALRHGDYNTAVILGKGLAYLLEAERGSYWGYVKWLDVKTKRAMPVYTAVMRALKDVASAVEGKIERDLEDDLIDIKKVTEEG